MKQMTDEQMINLLQLGIGSLATEDALQDLKDEYSEQDRDDLIDDGRSDGHGESYAERNT